MMFARIDKKHHAVLPINTWRSFRLPGMTSMGHQMPMELVRIIFNYLLEFHRYDAMERTRDMRATYRGPWSLVMGDVRANVPRYSLTLTGYDGQPISIYCPDCLLHPYLRLMANSIIQRRALSIHRNIRFV
jgi:hypothetical protein